MSAPTLFLDVDGVLLVDPGTAPKGYDTMTLRGNTYAYDPETPGWLHLLAQLYDLVWASHHWQGHEDGDLASLFGLPDGLPELAADAPDPPNPNLMNPAKLAAIEAAIGDEPCAIVDDRMGSAVADWATGKPVLLVQPKTKVGLTQAHVGVLTSFARSRDLITWPPGASAKRVRRQPRT